MRERQEVLEPEEGDLVLFLLLCTNDGGDDSPETKLHISQQTATERFSLGVRLRVRGVSDAA